MGKALPILGICGSVFAALSIAVFVPNSLAMFLPLLVGLVGSIVLVGQRNVPGAVVGLVLLVLTVVAALGLVGTVSREGGGDTSFGIAQSTGQVLLIVCCLGLPLAAVGLRWEQALPRWLTLGGGACALVALLIVASDAEAIGDQSQAKTLVAAVLALLSIAAMVPLVRAEGEEPQRRREVAPLVAADAPVTAHATTKASGPVKPVTPGSKPQPPRKGT